MKKIVASFLLLALMLVSFVSVATPAHAGDSPNIGICHRTGVDPDRMHIPGREPANTYSNPSVSKTAIVKGKSEHATDPEDIIPPFEYAENEGDPVLTYHGKNWDEEGQAIYNNGCVVPNQIVSPLPPLFEQATCMAKDGTFLPAVQRQGVLTTTAPSLVNGVWTVAYAPAAGYAFPEGTSGTYTFEVTPPGASDPLWDAEAGECRIANTGLAGIDMNTLVLAGGLIFAGMLFLGVTNFIGRRRKA